MGFHFYLQQFRGLFMIENTHFQSKAPEVSKHNENQFWGNPVSSSHSQVKSMIPKI